MEYTAQEKRVGIGGHDSEDCLWLLYYDDFNCYVLSGLCEANVTECFQATNVSYHLFLFC